jgi:hypothetical protein
VGQRVEQIGGGELCDPLRMIGDAGGSDDARGIAFGQHQRAQQDALRLGERLDPVRGHRGHPMRCRLLQLFAHEGGVDAEFIGRVLRKLVALDRMRHAADVRQQEVHRVHLGLRGAAGKLLARALD